MGTAPNLHLPHRRSPFQELQLNPRPFRRGPMYSAYAELREWRLRTKNSPISPSLPPPPPPSSMPTQSIRAPTTPMVSRSVQDLSMAFRKENKRPPSTSTPKHEAISRKTMSASRGREGMRKSYACLQELKEYSVMAKSAINEEGRGGAKGMVRKSVGIVGRQRQAPAWMG